MSPITFSCEAELQAAIARAPGELAAAVGFDGRRAIAIPREFPLANQPVDCLFITEDARIILVECKLARNPELRGEVASQVARYVDALRRTYALRLRGDLISCLDRYGQKWRRKLEQELGPASIEDGFWDEVEENLKAGRIEVVVAADSFPAETTRWFAEMCRQVPPTARCSLVRVTKRQSSDFSEPRFEIDRTDPAGRGAVETTVLWTPLASRPWLLIDLPKRQSRVGLVSPPPVLQVDDTVTWARNVKPEENHAVDPARTASFIPVMPNLGLLEGTGTPYPASDQDATVQPLPVDYRPWLEVGRAVWRRIAAQGRFDHPTDTLGALQEARARSPEFASHPLNASHGEVGVKSALRDLHLFGVGLLYRKPNGQLQLIRA